MFRHHKHCVIEVSGQLLAREGDNGRFDLYLADNAPDSAVNNDQRIKIADADFCAYVQQHFVPDNHAGFRLLFEARITGDVNMDGGETRLFDISQATLMRGEAVLRYDPRQLG